MEQGSKTARLVSRPSRVLSRVPDAAAAIFPMPLTSFEKYMFLDGLAGNSMVFVIQLEVEGRLDRDALAAAVSFAAMRHPLSRALVARRRYGRWTWLLDDRIRPAITYAAPHESAAAWNVAPDLTRESGVRVGIDDRGDAAAMTFHFHHACCDGVGALQWVEDVLAWYARLKGATSAEIRVSELDPARLLERDRHRVATHSGLDWWRSGLRELHRFFGRIPQPIPAAVTRSVPVAERFHGMASHRFTLDETRRLRVAAQERGAALNDLLVRDLFRTLADWGKRYGTVGDPWYRINMPTSLRERDDVRTPATNIVSYALLNQRRSSLSNEPDRLLAAVCNESDDVRRLPRATLFLDGVSIAAAIPGALAGVLRLPVCLSTAVLTNVGDPCRRFSVRFPRDDGMIVVGNLRVRTFGGVPPLRRLTHAAIGVNSYAGRLMLNLQMTPELFAEHDVRRFLATFVAQVTNSLDAA